jgi:superfamily I DNA/RNA helicase
LLVASEGGFEEALEHTRKLLDVWKHDDIAPKSVCVIARRHKDRDAAARFFAASGSSTRIIQANERDDPASEALRLATMHRAKGLEFDRVVVLATSDMLGPIETPSDERKVLYVAIPRARERAALLLY